MNIQRLFNLGLPAAKRSQSSFFSGLSYGAKGTPINGILAAFEVAEAERGQKVPTLLGKTAGIMAYPVLTGIATVGLSLIPGIGTGAAVFMSLFLAGYESDLLGNSISRKIKTFTEFGKRVRHLEMGGSYIDTELARRQRLLAIQDINATMIPRRRYLGQEALLMHR